MTQHNADVAYKLFEYKLLMPAVFKLLSSTNECKQETKVYALQLIRCMCQASRSISHGMVSVILFVFQDLLLFSCELSNSYTPLYFQNV